MKTNVLWQKLQCYAQTCKQFISWIQTEQCCAVLHLMPRGEKSSIDGVKREGLRSEQSHVGLQQSAELHRILSSSCSSAHTNQGTVVPQFGTQLLSPQNVTALWQQKHWELEICQKLKDLWPITYWHIRPQHVPNSHTIATAISWAHLIALQKLFEEIMFHIEWVPKNREIFLDTQHWALANNTWPHQCWLSAPPQNLQGAGQSHLSAPPTVLPTFILGSTKFTCLPGFFLTPCSSVAAPSLPIERRQKDWTVWWQLHCRCWLSYQVQLCRPLEFWASRACHFSCTLLFLFVSKASVVSRLLFHTLTRQWTIHSPSHIQNHSEMISTNLYKVATEKELIMKLHNSSL